MKKMKKMKKILEGEEDEEADEGEDDEEAEEDEDKPGIHIKLVTIVHCSGFLFLFCLMRITKH